MPEPISAPDSLEPLRPDEWRLMSTLSQAEDGANIMLAATPGPRFGLRGRFLRWYLAKAIPDTKQPITCVELDGFVVDGPLDLSGCKLAIRAVFACCRFTEAVDLTGAEVSGSGEPRRLHAVGSGRADLRHSLSRFERSTAASGAAAVHLSRHGAPRRRQHYRRPELLECPLRRDGVSQPGVVADWSRSARHLRDHR